MSPEAPEAPRWAERVAKWKIVRLYKDDELDLHDEELIDDVYYTLLERCRSMTAVAEARRGRAPCAVCYAVVLHAGQPNSRLQCEQCGWKGLWKTYRRSFNGQHLIAPGLEPFCREYIKSFPTARTPGEKMLRIDGLIHRFHWEGTALRGQPGATSLIEGRAQDVNVFLRDLSLGKEREHRLGDPERYWSKDQLQEVSVWRKRAERRAMRRHFENTQ